MGDGKAGFHSSQGHFLKSRDASKGAQGILRLIGANENMEKEYTSTMHRSVTDMISKGASLISSALRSVARHHINFLTGNMTQLSVEGQEVTRGSCKSALSKERGVTCCHQSDFSLTLGLYTAHYSEQ